jgi:hypothetical protein
MGSMSFADDPTVLGAPFSMGVGLRHSFEGDFDAMNMALQELLERLDGTLRPIRFLDTEIFTRRINAPETSPVLKTGSL